MQFSSIPTKFQIPWANSAGGGFIRNIPVGSQIAITPGAASLTDGWPPLNFSPVGSGGVPPFGQDMNGILKQITQWIQWQNAGGLTIYDSTFSTAIGGYPQGAVLAAAGGGGAWLSIVDNNTTNPDAGGAGWIAFQFRLSANNLNLYVNFATGVDTNPGTLALPFKNVQAAVTAAGAFAPGSASITINIADSASYAGFTTPAWAFPPLIITGNAGTPSNVVLTASSGSVCNISGPNIVTIQNLKIVQSGSTANANNGIFTSNGPQVTVNNVVFGAVGNSCFYANPFSTITTQGFTLSGNINAAFIAGGLGQIALTGVCTISAAITVGSSFAIANSGGIIGIFGGTFVNPGNVTGQRFSATLAGGINSNGGGINYIPGTIAGVATAPGWFA